MDITFHKYMDNPSTGTSVFTNRGAIRDMYRQKYNQLLVRVQGKIPFKVFITNDMKDTYYVCFKIPSETLEDFFYDVVIELFTKDNKLKGGATLKGYNVRFFSNDQAFTFSFAHAFNKNGLFIPVLKEKTIERCLKQKGDVRNPKDDVWYVKSLCFAFFTMERYNLFSRPMLNQNAIKYTKFEMLKNIATTIAKIEEHRVKTEEAQKKRQKAKELISRSQARSLEDSKYVVSNSPSIKSTRRTANVRTVGTVRATKRVIKR